LASKPGSLSSIVSYMNPTYRFLAIKTQGR
jgi:hypothetical protein